MKTVAFRSYFFVLKKIIGFFEAIKAIKLCINGLSKLIKIITIAIKVLKKKIKDVSFNKSNLNQNAKVIESKFA